MGRGKWVSGSSGPDPRNTSYSKGGKIVKVTKKLKRKKNVVKK